MLRLIVRFALLWAVADAIHNIRLGDDITLFWELDYSAGDFVAEIHVKNINPSSGWVGIGFSSRGNISDGTGDFCVIWKNQLGGYTNEGQIDSLQITDVHVKNETDTLYIDQQQDCSDFQFLLHNGTLKWTFRRKFITCDYFDYALEEGTTHLHWVKGAGPLYDIKGVSIKKALDHGFKRIRFLKNIEPPQEQQRINGFQGNDESLPWSFRILNTQVKVPPVETLYWCQIFKIPERVSKQKHHVVQFGSYIQKGNEDLVHHMEVFHCLTDASVIIPSYAGPCDASPPELSVCSRVIGAWAMGAEPLKYPLQAGLPIGGPDFNPYIRLEMHYNNPGLRADYVDSSGMEFWVTNELRQNDAGVIELGLEYTDKMAIPPRQQSFPLTGICNRECTSVSFPRDGITIFASQLHTHLTGARVITRHFRPSPKHENGYVELPFMNWDNHYSTHYQEIRRLKRPTKVLPGDALVTTCEYNTMDRENATLGGFAISDEMCVNYFHYYPRTNLEVCKSSISWKSLREYFHFMAEMEGQNINPEGAVSDNYHGIKWTPFRAKLLSDFYNKSPIDMQCNQSDGTRFPGSWDSMPVPNFPKLLPALNPNDECFI